MSWITAEARPSSLLLYDRNVKWSRLTLKARWYIISQIQPLGYLLEYFALPIHHVNVAPVRQSVQWNIELRRSISLACHCQQMSPLNSVRLNKLNIGGGQHHSEKGAFETTQDWKSSWVDLGRVLAEYISVTFIYSVIERQVNTGYKVHAIHKQWQVYIAAVLRLSELQSVTLFSWIESQWWRERCVSRWVCLRCSLTWVCITWRRIWRFSRVYTDRWKHSEVKGSCRPAGLTRYILILLNGMTENHRVHVITVTLRRRAAGLKLRRREVKILNEVL